ncbi:MAG: DUF4102 domain-containing protein [Gammaproteobacteria bacterium]|nr:DUF4102 domain-containing protein [Gammaproteobacteria bacterium]
MSLSDTAIKNAKAKDKPYKITDERGMYLLIDTKGNKYFRMDYRFNGKRKTLAWVSTLKPVSNKPETNGTPHGNN